jgi:hypothetical protein
MSSHRLRLNSVKQRLLSPGDHGMSEFRKETDRLGEVAVPADPPPS